MEAFPQLPVELLVLTVNRQAETSAMQKQVQMCLQQQRKKVQKLLHSLLKMLRIALLVTMLSVSIKF